MINVIERELHVDRPDLVYILFSGDSTMWGGICSIQMMMMMCVGQCLS